MYTSFVKEYRLTQHTYVTNSIELLQNKKATQYTEWPSTFFITSFRYFDGATRLGDTNRRFP